MPTDGGDESSGFVDKIQSLKQRVEQRERAKRAKRRASQRRVEKGDPETASEKAKVSKREAEEKVSEASEATSELAQSARSLIATELGVSSSEAESVVKRGAKALEAAGDRVDRLDTDGDGDTDILPAIEGATESQRRSRTAGGQRDPSEPPVGDIEDDFDEVATDGIEGELRLDYPLEEP